MGERGRDRTSTLRTQQARKHCTSKRQTRGIKRRSVLTTLVVLSAQARIFPIVKLKLGMSAAWTRLRTYSCQTYDQPNAQLYSISEYGISKRRWWQLSFTDVFHWRCCLAFYREQLVSTGRVVVDKTTLSYRAAVEKTRCKRMEATTASMNFSS